MDFLSLVKQRQSDRAFDPERSVEPEKLERILEAERLPRHPVIRNLGILS